MSLLHKIGNKPIIAAIRKMSDVPIALNSNVDNLFFMGGSINDIMESVRLTKEAGKRSFLHLDLIRGLSSTDKEAVEFVAKMVQADGIVSPKSHVIKAAKQAGLLGILHVFIIDSQALDNGLRSVGQTMPDGIEIMPGIAPKVIERFAKANESIPIIASGLISTVEEAREGLLAGATSLSVSENSLWLKGFSDLLP
ncbi:glycerol-3-phosphate responsive antiterminator GlpP [Paenibacillus agaridevorans]|uniref:Glycerol uptake operon antiterminator regulatory protein n=1 Tax=Paenibacillus agaridevorans TaxID=171404 RepID=A0A2R5ERD2_9BACL|nr:glycerol-3-phosphate responsive antiterminator [Paenibacillus agaridevorans]GBG08219.1 glycerol-3-phosphate responsive antiterminator GlpP [Paenibacillus agaridevorans]